MSRNRFEPTQTGISKQKDITSLKPSLLINSNETTLLTYSQIMAEYRRKSIYTDFSLQYRPPVTDKVTLKREDDVSGPETEQRPARSTSQESNKTDLVLYFNTNQASGSVFYEGSGFKTVIDNKTGSAKKVETYIFKEIKTDEIKKEKIARNKMTFFQIIDQVCEYISRFFTNHKKNTANDKINVLPKKKEKTSRSDQADKKNPSNPPSTVTQHSPSPAMTRTTNEPSIPRTPFLSKTTVHSGAVSNTGHFARPKKKGDYNRAYLKNSIGFKLGF